MDISFALRSRASKGVLFLDKRGRLGLVWTYGSAEGLSFR